ncbi:MAG: cation transporter [Deltaproteobacteria bacterium]|nr:cation transporter [Deltaproteobacteria bacterium]
MLKKTIFEIPKMDCPSEEQLIRFAFSKTNDAIHFEFNLKERTLTIYHKGEAQSFLELLLPLKLGSKILETSPVEANELSKIKSTSHVDESKTLKILLFINAFMFFSEIIFGWIAESTALIADSIDMLADATVYGLSLYAVGASIKKQKRAAKVSGYLQAILALGVLMECIRRFIIGSEPEPAYMMVVAFVALIANLSCMVLLAKHRHGGVHMKASWIFSTNDVIANIGVIIAGILVSIFDSRMPDLIIGSLIAMIVLFGALKILKISNEAAK